MSILARYSTTSRIVGVSEQSDRDDGFLNSSCGGGGQEQTEVARVLGPVSTRPPCLRCNSKTGALAVTRLRISDALCAACIESNVVSRLKKSMTNDPARGQNVLIAASSGTASLSAITIASQIMNCARKRRFWKDAAVVHVDCSILGHLTLAKQAKNLGSTTPLELEASNIEKKVYLPFQTVLQTSLSSGLHCYVLPIEAALIHDQLFILPVQAPQIILPEPSEGSGSMSGTLVSTDVVEKITKNACMTLQEFRGEISFKDEIVNTNADGIQNKDVRTKIQSAGIVLKEALSSMSASSDELQDIVKILIHTLIVRCAAALNFDVLQTCETADRMGLKVMLSACTGNGFTVPADVGVEDSRFREFGSIPGIVSTNVFTLTRDIPTLSSNEEFVNKSIRLQSNWYEAMLQDSRLAISLNQLPVIFRPLVEVEQREIMLFARFRNLVSTSNASALSFTVGAPLRTSISHTVMSVLSGLQATFPATVHNVVRTARKLIVPEVKKEEEDHHLVKSSTVSKKGSSYNLSAYGLCHFCFSLLPFVDKDFLPSIKSQETQEIINPNICYRCKRLAKTFPSLVK
jgi:hypothetical protein